jgi:hypothetical protein
LTENNVQHAMVAGPGASVPVVVISSREPGATVAIGANLHGDECTGVGVVHALIRELPAALRAGSVVLYPSLNPKGGFRVPVGHSMGLSLPELGVQDLKLLVEPMVMHAGHPVRLTHKTIRAL